MCDVNAQEYGLELLRHGSAIVSGHTASEVLAKDFKEFDLFDTRIGVSQTVVFAFEAVQERESEFQQAMRDVQTHWGCSRRHFLATDPLRRQSYLLVSGAEEAFEEAFGVRVEQGNAIDS